jgi:hypothetical protein
VQVCKDFFPNLYVGFKDPRVRLHVGDGMFTSRYLLVCSTIVMGYRILHPSLKYVAFDFFYINFDHSSYLKYFKNIKESNIYLKFIM